MSHKDNSSEADTTNQKRGLIGFLLGMLITTVGTAFVRKRSSRLRHLTGNAALLAAILESSDDAIFSKSLDGIILTWNAGAENIFGYAPKEIIGKPTSLIIPPDSIQHEEELMNDVRRGRCYRHSELDGIRKDGTRITLSVAVSPVRDEACEIMAASVVAQDISEQKRIKEELLQGRDRFRTMIDFTADWEYWVGPDGKLIYTSPSCEGITGYSPNEFIQDESLLNRIIHPNDRKTFFSQEAHRHNLGDSQEPEQLEIEFRIVRKNGELRWLGHICRPVLSDDGRLLGRRASNRDITERKQTQDALRESKQMLQLVLDTIPARVFWKDRELKFMGCNQKLADDVGVASPEQLVGLTDYDISSRDRAEIYRSDDSSVMESGEPKIGYLERVRGPVGTDIWVRTNKIPLRDTNGYVIGVLGTYEDVTEQKEAEEALKRSEERLKTLVETMAQGVVYQNSEGKIVSVNPAAEKILGLPADQLKERSSFCDQWQSIREDGSYFPAEQHPSMVALQTGKQVANVLMGVFNPRENRHRWVNISSVPLFRSGDNEPWQVYSTFEDVTELMTLRRTLEQQLSVLRKALIPAVSREIEGYTLAADYRPVFVSQVIGGDFYDVFPVEDGRVGILIGDVAGKGIEAASLATATRSTVRAYAYEMRNTSEAMGHANSVLCAQQQSDWGTFVTVFLLILDPLSGSIDYCSAGHPPAILYRHSGVTELLEAANPPIGLWDKHKFNNATNKIDSGDRIILYTDGITESRHRSQLFGEEGIQRVLLEHGCKNLNDLMQEIVAASIDWSEGSLADDAALILLERKQASSDYRAETAPSTAQHPITPHL